MTNLGSTLKSRDITLPTKVRLVKAMVFPIVMYVRCESWTRRKLSIKELMLLNCGVKEDSSWESLDSKKIQPVNLKVNQSEYSLEGLMFMLKLQYFDHLMQRNYSFEKTLMLEKIEGRRRRGQQRMRWLDGITNSWTWVWVNSGSWWWTGRPGVL